MEPQFVDIQGAAALLGVPRKKVAGLVRDGVLVAEPSVLDKRRKLIRRSDLEALLAREGKVPVRVEEPQAADPTRDSASRQRKRIAPNEDEARELLKRTLKRVRRKGKNNP